MLWGTVKVLEKHHVRAIFHLLIAQDKTVVIGCHFYWKDLKAKQCTLAGRHIGQMFDKHTIGACSS